MTIADLIALLGKFDSALPVHVIGEHGDEADHVRSDERYGHPIVMIS